MSMLFSEKNQIFRAFALVLTLMVAVVGGGSALAADFVWDGSCLQPETDVGLWSCDDNWTPSGEPTTNDNVVIGDPSPTPICRYDLTSPISIGNLEVVGSSPTKMTLHVSGTSLTAANLDLDNYGQLDLDQNFTVSGVTTLVDGSGWIDVGASRTCDLEDVDVIDSAFHLTATTTGTLLANEVLLDADADGAARSLKFSGGTWTIDNKFTLKSDQTSGTDDAKLWVSAGTVDITGGSGTGILEIDGGTDSTRRVELDIDDTLKAEQTDVLSGSVLIDVASGKTTKGGTVIFKAGSVMTKSGSGTFKSGN